MSGKEILEAAGGILSSCHIVPSKAKYTFGEQVSGTVTICLSKPIFFVHEGLIQLTLEGKEIFSYEENTPLSGVSHTAASLHRVSHVDKFYRSRQILYNS